MSMRRAHDIPEPPSQAELLEPHRHRLICDFIVSPDPGNHSDTKVRDAFWDLVYDAHPSVEHDVARAVGRELMESGRTIADVVDGWKPTILT